MWHLYTFIPILVYLSSLYIIIAGHNSQRLWADITSAIKTVYLQKEAALISASSKYSSSRSVTHLYTMIMLDWKGSKKRVQHISGCTELNFALHIAYFFGDCGIQFIF